MILSHNAPERTEHVYLTTFPALALDDIVQICAIRAHQGIRVSDITIRRAVSEQWRTASVDALATQAAELKAEFEKTQDVRILPDITDTMTMLERALEALQEPQDGRRQPGMDHSVLSTPFGPVRVHIEDVADDADSDDLPEVA